MGKFKEYKELYEKKTAKIVGKFGDKPTYPHNSNKLPKFLYDSVKEKINQEIRGFGKSNNI